MTPTESEKNWALIIHLSAFAGFLMPFLGPLLPVLFWLIKRNDSSYLNRQGKEAANLALTCYIVLVGSLLVVGFLFLIAVGVESATPVGDGPAVATLIIALLFSLLAVGAMFYQLMGSLIAAVKLSTQDLYRHKLPFRFLK